MSVVFPVPLGPNRKNDFFFKSFVKSRIRLYILTLKPVSVFNNNPQQKIIVDNKANFRYPDGDSFRFNGRLNMLGCS
jgi:hypothetical protein